MALRTIPNRRKKKQKSSLLLTLSATGLLIAIGVLVYCLFTQGKPLTRDLPVGVEVIPQDAVLAVSLTTEAKQWQKLQEFGTASAPGELAKNLAQLRNHLLTNSGYDFEKDIQPWVGNAVTIAVLPAPLVSSAPKPITNEINQTNQLDINGSGQSLIMVLPVRDREIARNSLVQTKIPPQGQWVYRVYQGITIKQTQGQEGLTRCAALLDGHFLVVTDHPSTMEKAIDAYKNKVSLATVAGFGENVDKISSFQPFAQFYLNVPVAARISATDPNRHLPAQVLTQLQNNQGLAGTVTLEPEGLSLRGISWLNPQSQRLLLVENKAGNMQNRLPEETLMMLSGSNLQSWWREYVSTSEGNPQSPIAPDQLRQGVKSLANLDLERDLLSWMQGEFSLAVIPYHPQPGLVENFHAGLVLMAQSSDRQATENVFKQIDSTMQNQYQFKVQPGTVGGKQVINWISPFGTLTATHGWLDGDVAFFILGAPISNLIVPQPSNTLASNLPFQQTVPRELNPLNGLFFLDVEQMDKNFTLNFVFPNQRALLESTKTIGVTSSVSDSRSTRYDIFIALKKAGNLVQPQPSPKN